jgi:hypothetical protein
MNRKQVKEAEKRSVSVEEDSHSHSRRQDENQRRMTIMMMMMMMMVLVPIRVMFLLYEKMIGDGMIALLDRQVGRKGDLVTTYVIHYQSHRPISDEAVRRILLLALKPIAVPSPARRLLSGIQQQRQRHVIEHTDTAIITITITIISVSDRLVQA